MDTRFAHHNSHLENPEKYDELDPYLRMLGKQKILYRSPIMDRFPDDTPGIYSITGGRQTGKSTLMKQWVKELLEKKTAPERILYLTGELIEDHHSLVRLISEAIESMPKNSLCYLLIDEVTYIRDWDKGIKFAADAGILENIFLLITGSDSVIINEARMRFPGRRGTADPVDFKLYPLSFSEYFELTEDIPKNQISLLSNTPDLSETFSNILFRAFNRYLIHGGFLTAINNFEESGAVPPATFYTYSDWIRGDVLKRGKQEQYLREVLGAIVSRYGSQITWNALSRDLSIDHPKTVADYVALLESMGVVFVQAALMEDKLTASPKKARKVMFTDPFIFHAVRSWLSPDSDPFRNQVQAALSAPMWPAKLAEACVATHFSRQYPTYYIKAKGEIDVVYVHRGRFWPLEVKWTTQIRPKDLKQILKYPNGKILTQARQHGKISGIPTEPLPVALLRLGQ